MRKVVREAAGGRCGAREGRVSGRRLLRVRAAMSSTFLTALPPEISVEPDESQQQGELRVAHLRVQRHRSAPPARFRRGAAAVAAGRAAGMPAISLGARARARDGLGWRARRSPPILSLTGYPRRLPGRRPSWQPSCSSGRWCGSWRRRTTNSSGTATTR